MTQATVKLTFWGTRSPCGQIQSLIRARCVRLGLRTAQLTCGKPDRVQPVYDSHVSDKAGAPGTLSVWCNEQVATWRTQR